MTYKLQHTLHVLVVLLAIHIVLIMCVEYIEKPYANHGGARGRKGSVRWKLDSSVMGGVHHVYMRSVTGIFDAMGRGMADEAPGAKEMKGFR